MPHPNGSNQGQHQFQTQNGAHGPRQEDYKYGKARFRRSLGAKDSWRSDGSGRHWQESANGSWRDDWRRSNERWAKDLGNEPSWRQQNGNNFLESALVDDVKKQLYVDRSNSMRKFGSGGGRDGMLPLGPSKARHRYSTGNLAKIYRQLLYTGKLQLPRIIERDDPLLFTSQDQFVDVVEQLQGVHNYCTDDQMNNNDPGNSELQRSLIGSEHVQGEAAFAEGSALPAAVPSLNQWVYKDPQGMLQGPFGKELILEWYQHGFFPLDLQIRNAGAPPHAPFITLSAALEEWGAVQPPIVQKQAPMGDGPSLSASSSHDMPLGNTASHGNAIIAPERLAFHSETVNTDQLLQQLSSGEAPAYREILPIYDTSVSVEDVRSNSSEAVVTHDHEQRLNMGMESHWPQHKPAEVRAAASDPISAEHFPKEFSNQDNNALSVSPSEIPMPRQRPETKPAPWVEKQNNGPAAVSLTKIQEQERAEKEEKLKIAEEAGHQLSKQSKLGWASIAKTSQDTSVSLVEIQQQEIKAKSKGDEMFWDYDSSQRSAALPPPPPPVNKRIEHLAFSGPPMKTGGWAAAASSPTPVKEKKVAPPLLSPNTKPKLPQPMPPPPPPRETTEGKQQEESVPSLSLADIPSISEGPALAGEFREWCEQQMKSLTGSEEVTLCEFLMSVESNSEVADYIAAYLGATPAAASFSAEFLRRKLAALAAGSGKKSRKARAKARARAAAAANESSGAVAAIAETADDSSWEKVGAGTKKNRGKEKSGNGSLLQTSGSKFAVLGMH